MYRKIHEKIMAESLPNLMKLSIHKAKKSSKSGMVFILQQTRSNRMVNGRPHLHIAFKNPTSTNRIKLKYSIMLTLAKLFSITYKYNS